MTNHTPKALVQAFARGAAIVLAFILAYMIGYSEATRRVTEIRESMEIRHAQRYHCIPIGQLEYQPISSWLVLPEGPPMCLTGEGDNSKWAECIFEPAQSHGQESPR